MLTVVAWWIEGPSTHDIIVIVVVQIACPVDGALNGGTSLAVFDDVQLLAEVRLQAGHDVGRGCQWGVNLSSIPDRDVYFMQLGAGPVHTVNRAELVDAKWAFTLEL